MRMYSANKAAVTSAHHKSLTISSVEWVFAMLCIFLRDDYEKYEKLCLWGFIALVSVPTLITEAYLCLTLDSFIERSDVALFCVSTLSINFILLAVHYRRQSFVEIHKAITAENPFIDEKFTNISDELLKHTLLRFGSSVIVCVILLAVFPLLIASCTEAENGSLPTLLYPFIYPWRVTSVFAYLATLSFQLICGILPLMTVAGIILFMLLMKILLNCCLLRIRKHIREIDVEDTVGDRDDIDDTNEQLIGLLLQNCNWQRKKEKEQKEQEDWKFRNEVVVPIHYRHRRYNLSNGNDDILLRKLHAVIRHHQFLVKLVNNIIYATENCAVVGAIQFMAGNICVIPIVLMVDVDQLYRMKMLNMMIISDMFFFLCCNMGEWLNHLNSLIRESIYEEMRWYRRSLTFRKDLTIFMTILQKSFVIRTLKLANINLKLFTSLLKNTYSAVQIILKAQHK